MLNFFLEYQQVPWFPGLVAFLKQFIPIISTFKTNILVNGYLAGKQRTFAFDKAHFRYIFISFYQFRFFYWNISKFYGLGYVILFWYELIHFLLWDDLCHFLLIDYLRYYRWWDKVYHFLLEDMLFWYMLFICYVVLWLMSFYILKRLKLCQFMLRDYSWKLW